MTVSNGSVQIPNQAADSVRVMKIVDTSIPEAPPTVTAQVPSTVATGELYSVVAQGDPAGVPAIGYRWDFGDVTTGSGAKAAHAYTREAISPFV